MLGTEDRAGDTSNLYNMVKETQEKSNTCMWELEAE